jgi:sigma-B regulation protein RsbU (phosphoserine phosphatase)
MRLASQEIWGGTCTGSQSHRCPHFEAHVFTRAAGGGEGGDIHSFHAVETGAARLLVADVMGHGPRVARTARWLYREFLDALERPNDCEVLSDVNERILSHRRSAMTTAVVMGIDLAAGELTWANAGHLPILFYRDDAMGWRVLWQVEPGIISGIPLGARPETEYFTRRAPVQSGDRFLVVTDGVIDALGQDDVDFGFDRLRAILQDHRFESVEDVFRVAVDSVVKFANGHLDHDDVTLAMVGVR